MTQMYYPDTILKLQRNGDGSAFILLLLLTVEEQQI